MTADPFPDAFAAVVGHEGGYGADPRDKGNWTGGKVGSGDLKGTKFGISAASYPTLDIRNLTLDQAREVYHRDYWLRLACDVLPAPLALVVFDPGVNAGVGAAAAWLQQALGVRVDGAIGLAARKAAAGLRDGDVQAAVISVLVLRMLHNASASTWPIYGLGWTWRVLNLMVQATGGDKMRRPRGSRQGPARLTLLSFLSR
ncbi:hypothetical protein E2C06_33585 [Dankookia rubra]|uniref:TtsA-like Glycoside hydrolase family 108 domain-containing protein n=1 Tax=Dankookia rubra TaxID=1442381 RepID=A0A4R5Q729_9PROT|nr:glycosyl hydrolase 108 family protein [Dankookia rubra]TDH58248.1 hypothetical protein E2C06_33585 [Dankookia rubra]